MLNRYRSLWICASFAPSPWSKARRDLATFISYQLLKAGDRSITTGTDSKSMRTKPFPADQRAIPMASSSEGAVGQRSRRPDRGFATRSATAGGGGSLCIPRPRGHMGPLRTSSPRSALRTAGLQPAAAPMEVSRRMETNRAWQLRREALRISNPGSGSASECLPGGVADPRKTHEMV